jgi:hypothetical protein
MDYGLWIGHGSVSAAIGASLAALCCAAVMLGAGHGSWGERWERPAVLLCFVLALAAVVCALTAVPSVDPDDLAKALVMGWGIVLARRLRARLIRFTRETWWSPSP